MSRIAYVAGRFLPLARAAVPVEDRGLQFADSIYEVVYRHDGRWIDAGLHLDRLERSLGEIRLTLPVSRPALLAIWEEVARRNRLRNGLLYLQVTRGTAPRAHAFPDPAPRPTLIVTMRRVAPYPASPHAWAAAAITRPDERWARCDIKSTSLLPNVLAKQAAREAGAVEAILLDGQGNLTEGSSTTVWIVDSAGALRTPPLGRAILPGCTRRALSDELHAAGIAFTEGAISAESLATAREIFLTSATSFVRPITRLDGRPVGTGAVGPVTERLFRLFARHVQGGSNLPP